MQRELNSPGFPNGIKMKHVMRVALIVLTAMLAGPTPAHGADLLSLYMSEIPGQTMQNEDEPGTALEIVRVAAKHTGFKLNEAFVPWTRAVAKTAKDANAIIIPFARTPKRERNYTWIMELYSLQFGFVSLDMPVNDKAAARRLKRVGVWRGSSMEEELQSDGFKNLNAVSNDRALTRMLVAGRLQAWYGSLSEAAYMFRGIEQINRRRIRFGTPTKSIRIWLAGGLEMPKATVERLRNAVQTMHDNGTVQSIIERYGIN